MLDHLDKSITIFVQQNFYSENLAKAFHWWTDFLNSPLFKVLFLVVFLYSVYPRLKSSIKRFPLVFVGGYVFDRSIHFMKESIARKRPDFIELGLDLSHRCIDVGGFAFPSGHSSMSFFIVGLVSVFSWQRQVLWWALAVLIVIPRVYCGIHYFGDVLTGAVLGYFVGRMLGKFVFSEGETNV
ncbi:MAG: phosphatase PAP2 family protein [Bdellovibrionota bacterium]|nr:phosphatase PAP2 family protein [Bdellovibrionota bacterium]